MFPARQIKQQPTLLILLLLVLVVPLLAFGVLRVEGPRIRGESLANLSAIGRLKSDQIENWLNERRGDAEVLMARQGFINDAQRWFENRDAGAWARIAKRFSDLRPAYSYQDVALIDARAPAESMTPAMHELFARALATGQVQISQLYQAPTGDVWMDFIAPLIKSTSAGPLRVGVVVLHTHAKRYLFPLVQTWPTASPSAETLLVRRDGDNVQFLNDLRYRKGAALNMVLPLNTLDLPAAVAARERKVRTLEGHDYRGVPVLAAVRPVKGTDWLLVAKVDMSEVLRPLHQLVLWVALVALAAIVAVAFVLRRLW